MEGRALIVLDTHVWLWWAADRAKISRTLARRLEAEEDLCVSAISFWEVAMLVERGRLTFSTDVRLALRELGRVPRVRVVPLDDDIATEAALLGDRMHGDPADRFIVATALELAAPLATKDEKIRKSKLVATVW